MDRKIVYPGALPQDVDVLQPQRNMVIALGQIIGAMLGFGTTRLHGLECVPGSGLSVVVQSGVIFVAGVVDANTYGSLAADGHATMKQGALRDATPLNTPAPTTVGHSINYLIQARYLEVDGSPLVLPYYNAADPSTPLSGPGGNNAAQNTARSAVCDIQVLAGASAPTDSQATPAVSSGYYGLAVVTIDYGQTEVLAGDIVIHGSRPSTVSKAILDHILSMDGPGCGLSVDEAVNSATLGGKQWVVVAEGTETHPPAYYRVKLHIPPTSGHRMYAISAYSPDCQVVQGHQSSSADDIISVYQGTDTGIANDKVLVLADWNAGGSGDKTLHYKIWEWK